MKTMQHDSGGGYQPAVVQVSQLHFSIQAVLSKSH